MSEPSVPKTKEEVVEFALEVQQKLFEKYKEDGEKFIDGDQSYTGLLYRCMGSMGLLYLPLNIDEVELKNDRADVIKNEFKEVINYIEENGFNISPYGELDFFSPEYEGDFHYVDSVAWVLSLAVCLRCADQKGILELEESLSNKVKNYIKKCLKILADSFVDQGDSGGWGFTKDAIRPSVYFTKSVIETFVDVGTYILGEEEELGFPKDEKFLEEIKDDDGLKDIEKLVRSFREKVSHWIWEEFFDEMTDPSKEFKPFGKELGHNRIYYQYFILIMAISSYMDEFITDVDIKTKFEHALYLTRIDFENAKNDPDWWNDPEESVLDVKISGHKNKRLEHKFKKKQQYITEPAILPQALRTNLFYSLFISQGEDSKIDDQFELLWKKRFGSEEEPPDENSSPKEFLWDDIEYSLPITERAIEAIFDYYDYLNRFQNMKTKSVTETDEISKNQSFESLIDQRIEKFFQSETGRKVLDEATGETGEEASDNGTLSSEQLVQQLGGIFSEYAKKEPRWDETFPDRFQQFISSLILDMIVESANGNINRDNIKKKMDSDGAKLLERIGFYWDQSSSKDLAEVFDELIHKST